LNQVKILNEALNQVKILNEALNQVKILNEALNQVKILPVKVTSEYYFIANNQTITVNKEVEK